MQSIRCLALAGLILVLAAGLGAQSPAVFTRPGTITIADLRGTATAVSGENEKELKTDERLRAEVALKTPRRSMIVAELSNGSLLRLGSETELVVDEYWQQPHSVPGKSADWKEEPSASLTRLRLVTGDVTATVKPLQVARGAGFSIESMAGTVRITRGVVVLRLQMTPLGLGIFAVELQDGVAEFEPVSGAFRGPLTPGKRLNLAIEIERGTNSVKLSEAPKDVPQRSGGK